MQWILRGGRADKREGQGWEELTEECKQFI